MDFVHDNPVSDFNASLVDLLRQIIEVLETSSIAEERGKGEASKFWAAYKKISGEYDDNMLERCNANMDVIMLFAGLFSAVNTAFLIAMQPNPGDTTNQLLMQFMQNTWNTSSVVQPVVLSATVTYSSSKLWMQALAYASLTFSLLAAFFSVLGKQWLSYYKTNRFDRGALGDRCRQRHRKFLELEKSRFERVLQSFPVLLQISLFLFILSLAASTWMQHKMISLFIVVPTGCSFLFFVYTIVVSLRSPDSPFQTWITLAIQSLLHIDHQSHEDSTASAMSWILDASTNPDVLSLALDLMVTMSNQPQHVLSNQPQHVLSDTLIAKVLGMFKACFHTMPLDQSNALSFGRALIHMSWKRVGANEILDTLKQEWDSEHWSSWRSMYLPSALEQCNISFGRMKKATVATELRDQADNMRTALRMALGAGMNGFVNPDEKHVELVWNGQFGLDPNLPNGADVGWLMDCAKQLMDCAKRFNDIYLDAAGDALLLFSDLKEQSNIDPASITPFLESSPRSRTLRHSALRAACRAVDFNSRCDSYFSEAVLTAISPLILRGHDDKFANAIGLLNATDQYSPGHPLKGSSLIDIQRLIFLVLSAPSPDNTEKFVKYYKALIDFMGRNTSLDFKRVALRHFHCIRQDLVKIANTPHPSITVRLQNEIISELSPALLAMLPSESDPDCDFYYLGLIFTLASSANWHYCLNDDGHIKRCIKIIPAFRDQPSSSLFYLAGIFLHTDGQPAVRDITEQQWWDMTRMAWHVAGSQENGSHSDVLDDGIDILETLVSFTKSHKPPNASTSDLEFLRNGLGGVIDKLDLRRSPPSKKILSAVKDLKKDIGKDLDLSYRSIDTIGS